MPAENQRQAPNLSPTRSKAGAAARVAGSESPHPKKSEARWKETDAAALFARLTIPSAQMFPVTGTSYLLQGTKPQF